MEINLQYYGTTLDQSGHYMWELNKNFNRSKYKLGDIPFNPEGLPYKAKALGEVQWGRFAGFTVCSILGSCTDDRTGSKSVFFIEKEVKYGELMEIIKSNEIAMKIINQLPFNCTLKTTTA